MRFLEQITNIEKRLWGSADTLRANSNFASNEYFMPVMGLIFLRHAYSRFLKVRDEIRADARQFLIAMVYYSQSHRWEEAIFELSFE